MVCDDHASGRRSSPRVARGWSGPDAKPGWALVAALFDAVADDAALLHLAAEIPPDRLPAVLVVASIQRVVADHPLDPLRRYYPGPHQQVVDASFAPTLHALVTAREAEIRRWFDHRYQMNESAGVHRSRWRSGS